MPVRFLPTTARRSISTDKRRGRKILGCSTTVKSLCLRRGRYVHEHPPSRCSKTASEAHAFWGYAGITLAAQDNDTRAASMDKVMLQYVVRRKT